MSRVSSSCEYTSHRHERERDDDLDHFVVNILDQLSFANHQVDGMGKARGPYQCKEVSQLPIYSGVKLICNLTM
jgi:hypothetical protein